MADNSKVLKCTCKNEFQDKRYGLNMRVFNKGRVAWRCTSCTKEVPLSFGDKPAEATKTPKKKS